MKFRVLDLFSGIGGFSLGLERAGGFRTEAFCEIEPYCRQELEKNWPGVRCYDDVRELTAERLSSDGITVDVIAGGFPCQDISGAGKKAGISGSRSGLWSEYARLVRELQPKFVIVENVARLLSDGMGRVLGDLAEIGFDAEWECIPASAVGAPHPRDRAWIVAYPRREGLQGLHEAGWRKHLQSTASSLRRYWEAEPAVARVDYGLPRRLVVNEIRAFGNSVVPQIPELIGRAILKAEGLSP
jgi:DNA (cytosine-5)-methyltransferase 1